MSDRAPPDDTQGDIDNGRLMCVLGVRAIKPAEFVIFRIQQTGPRSRDLAECFGHRVARFRLPALDLRAESVGTVIDDAADRLCVSQREDELQVGPAHRFDLSNGGGHLWLAGVRLSDSAESFSKKGLDRLDPRPVI